MTLDITGAFGAAPHDVAATTKRLFPKYTLPAAYVTGGDGPLKVAVGLGKIFAVLGLVAWNTVDVIVGYYSPDSDKILWFTPAGAQIANGVNLSQYIAYLEVIGQ